ncbi:hypothetical protein MKY98_19360 [Paenibacillus sp. FSL M8-0228]|uniref:hypothetical protein n=1 Tax=Paenibacillus sp. FSL M8-0228 TaxID=2921620 RepID=UPI0030FA89EE
MELVKVKNGLLTEKYTTVHHEKDYQYSAPHYFEVHDHGGNVLGIVHFQEGPIQEAGVNGVTNEDLIAMVLARLEGFQNSEFRCRDNAVVITKLEEALLWLRKRTLEREARGVEGTHTV